MVITKKASTEKGVTVDAFIRFYSSLGGR